MPSLFKGPPGPTSQEKNLQQAEANAATFGLNQAESTLPKATSLLGQPLQFFQALLTGDRQTIMNTIAPAVSTITSQYETAKRANQEFAPRGGGATAANAEAPYKEAGDISQLVEGAQQEGAAGVTDIASLLGNLGLGELGTGTQAALGGASLAEQQRQFDTQTQQQQQQAWGSAIGGLVALIAGI